MSRAIASSFQLDLLMIDMQDLISEDPRLQDLGDCDPAYKTREAPEVKPLINQSINNYGIVKNLTNCNQ